MITEQICITLVKIWRISVYWFKRCGKKSIDTVDLGSEQIAFKEGRDALLDFVFKRRKLHQIGENLAQIGPLVQEIWQKQFCLRSGQIAVKEGRDGNFGLRL